MFATGGFYSVRPLRCPGLSTSALVEFCPSQSIYPHCKLPAETCHLARPAPLRFIGIWRLLCTPMEMCPGREAATTPPEKQVLSRIGGI